MFPFDFFKLLIKDTWEDIKFLYRALGKVSRGEPVIDKSKVEQIKTELKGMSPMSILKENWLWFLCIAFALVVGWMLASKYYEIQCNNFIIENYIRPQIANMTFQNMPLGVLNP